VTITMTPTVAALRPRVLSAQGSPFALSTAVGMWREQVPSLSAPAGMRDAAAFASSHPTHNSIPATLRSTVVPTVGGTPVHTDRGVYGAAKQAAPPRGVPR
jgi:hypothetical protein